MKHIQNNLDCIAIFEIYTFFNLTTNRKIKYYKSFLVSQHLLFRPKNFNQLGSFGMLKYYMFEIFMANKLTLGKKKY